MPFYLQILIALGLDQLLGDPRWLPHPVRGMGKLALWLENPLRARLPERRAGIAAVVLVVGMTVVVTVAICSAASRLHPLFGNAVAIWLIYTALAMRDLRDHALAVYRPLTKGDLVTARSRARMLVGRDTENLNEAGISRATVESVAENSVDGVTAPLLFSLFAGAPGALFYKAVNTLDSTFGYKNEHYLQFGWAAARLDDVVNFLPARISALLVPLAAVCTGLDGRQSWRIFRRDRNNHPSPNGGQIEAAMAGALQVRLGGENSYFGKKSFRPYMGDAGETLQAKHIPLVIRLMQATTLCALVAGLLMICLWRIWGG
ncbi:adenosylcobinamide-phosphate synthase CbiB [Trichloromonas sp.]|uniref:adenosylcobinamide-phosphate synthase CbiB n=1 Tax=Trichloromonas sp. TaxID=3069249 RepID=UPI001DE64EA6|nr:cobalamin biosynthesis protein CobD [Desulfuromonadaceae bacterium]MDY0269863.1 adenosylcobinamide-phosphate synthase CbiB [Trichloromonas sp.]